MNKVFNFLFFLFVILLFASCGGNSFYDKQVVIEDNLWPKEKAIHFNVDVTDTTKLYDFYLIIRHTNDYRYSNIFFFLNTFFPNGNETTDTIECILASDEGRWLGKGYGSIKEDDILLNKNMMFPVAGEYNFYFFQGMRQDTLKDIVSLGLRITESQ